MRFALKSSGQVIASRDTGREIREKIEHLIEQMSATDTLYVDLEGVVAVSPSAADELFGRLFSELASGQFRARRVILEHVDADAEEILSGVFKRREVFAPALDEHNRLRLIGAPEYLEKTYEAAVALKEFTTSDIAEQFHLTLPAANNRLMRLWRTNLVARKESSARRGGREYVYSAGA